MSDSRKQKPEKSIRMGTVTADIFRRQSPDGYPYFDFTLTRNWQNKVTGKGGSSRFFFEGSVQDIERASKAAMTWIHGQRAGARESRAA